MNVRRMLTTAVLCVALSLGGAGAATAAVIDQEPPTGYAPVKPTDPTLTATTEGVCENDVPWIRYSVQLVDPDGLVTTNQATLTLSSGATSTTIALGTLQNGRLQGRVLWPGAAVSGGVGTAWPGWETVNGELVATGGNFGWTRGAISAVVSVNPDVAVALSYPPGGCDPAPAASAGLAVTGASAGPLIGLMVAGGIVVAGGVLLVVIRRRRA